MPLFNFLVNFIETYRKSKDQLTNECFGPEIFNLETHLQSSGPYDPIKFRTEFEQLEEHVIDIQKALGHIQPFEAIINNLEFLLRLLEGLPFTERNLLKIEQKVSFIFSNYCMHRSETQTTSSILNKTFYYRILRL